MHDEKRKLPVGKEGLLIERFLLDKKKEEVKPPNVRHHERLCQHLNEIYAVKNEAYGNSFTKTWDEYGPTMLCIRLDDKLGRAKQLLLHAAFENDESVVDTLLDLANYALMGVMELQKSEHEKSEFCNHRG